MNLYPILFLAIFIISCGSPNNKDTAANKTEEISEVKNDSLNTLVEDDIDGGQMLLGQINKQGLRQEEFESWFEPNAAAHTLDTAVVRQLEPYLADVRIIAFMGTWCEDSQREIPTLYEILEASNFNMDHFTLYAVDHDKETPQDYEDGLNVDYVPTLIFYRDGEEIGRFVEYAQQSLEKDILAIVSGAVYSHPYAE